MQGSYSIDPAKLDAARKAYADSTGYYQPQLVDDKGRSTAVDPFIVDPDTGATTFNRWIDAENKSSAQNAWFNDEEIGADGKRTVVRRPMWQAFTEYTNDEARGQFDYISKALADLQNTGFGRMEALYKKALKKVS